jgi:hypothetical protein
MSVRWSAELAAQPNVNGSLLRLSFACRPEKRAAGCGGACGTDRFRTNSPFAAATVVAEFVVAAQDESAGRRASSGATPRRYGVLDPGRERPARVRFAGSVRTLDGELRVRCLRLRLDMDIAVWTADRPWARYRCAALHPGVPRARYARAPARVRIGEPLACACHRDSDRRCCGRRHMADRALARSQDRHSSLPRLCDPARLRARECAGGHSHAATTGWGSR